MTDSSGTLWTKLQPDGANPVIVVVYSDLAERRELVEATAQLAASDDTREVTDLQDVFSPAVRTTTFLVVPNDEEAALQELEWRRDELAEREAPVVMFLFDRGKGIEVLRESPALASWVRGRHLVPAERDRIDAEAERRKFRAETGHSPEEWLDQWNSGGISDSLDANVLKNWALMLVSGRDG